MNKQIKLILSISLTLLSFYNYAQKKPNVLVIYTDDHRYSGVHALGGMPVKTPNLDKLAENGMAFTKTYLMGAFTGATCVPSRAMLHTGKQLFHLKGRGFDVPESHTTMGQTFMKAGYYAYHVGKWHQDFNTLARSFHDGAKVSGKPAYLTDQFRMPYHDWETDPTKYNRKNCYLLEYDKKGKVVKRPLAKTDKRGPTATEKVGPHVSEVLADEAAGFIKEYKKEQPFFMYLAFPTPHDPRQAPDTYKKMYPEDKMELTPSYMSQHPFHNGHIVLRDEQLGKWPRDKEVARKHLSNYYAIITHLDAQIGRVIKSLKKSGQYENTIIVMAGDSGLAVGNHGLLGKQNIYDEDGIHIPFIISGGLIAKENKGRRVNALSYVHDIFPTVCDLAGIEKPNTIDGESLLPVIENKKEQIREYSYHAYRQHQRAFRKGAYKLIEYVRAPTLEKYGKPRVEGMLGSRVTQLFNTEKDPWETLNLADFPEYYDKMQEMRKEMREKAMELEDYADGDRTNVDFWQYY
ncbi:arylsulfatase A-like enzyme [Wenyingzhuangia heitensis]|uniref:Arylsulfatase A-like enzyme n=1 Tax=Wenyingzhuangia heitensis TaxID=1487859 RepID=A0ABX0U969_9FLAO|nr:sulfatase-like hydrolase/transferase [Wenyingzhuangia heitensis]NIJ44904.1 arylsulfatase A-like enzyme [Wenyingzhuangia heitensis]